MPQYQHIKRYQNFYGVDFKSNDLQFPENFATEIQNVQFTPTGSIEKRRGYQPHSEPGAKYGIFTYNRIDSNGVEQPEVLGVSNTVQRLAEAKIVITYSGSNSVCNIQVGFDVATDQYRMIIEEGTTEVLNQGLGLGVDVGGPYSVNSLTTAINALTGFTAVLTGNVNTPASFIKTIPLTSIVSSPISCVAKYWENLNVIAQAGKAGPLQGSETNKNAVNFENVSSVQVQNCIYFSNGYDPVLKYDGQNVYRAGLPPATDGSTGTFTVSATGTAGANLYVWREQFVQIDANGNQIEGNTVYSSEYLFTQPSVNPATVTVTSIQAGSGFNTNCALITATATGTAIPVSAGHTIKAGDTAYLWDTVTAAYVTREVVSVGATTVTVDNSIGYTSSTTNSRNVISNNLRIRILRNKNTGVTPTLFFELVEIPNNSFVSSQTFVDNLADASLAAQFLEPVTDRSPPVNGKYISAYQNIMVTAGNISLPNQVSFSDIGNPEYFPLVSNQFTVTNLQGDIITGIHPSAESFLIFQSRAIHAVTGDVPNQSFRVDVLTQDVGCAAHATIQDVRGTICFLSNVGPRVMTGAALPKGLGSDPTNQLNSRLDPLFFRRGLSSTESFSIKRAVGFNDRIGERYIVFLPTETTEGAERYTNSNSKTLVYDYTRDAWVIWSNLDMTGGITAEDSSREIYFVERRDSAAGSGSTSIQSYLYRFQNTGTFLDYQDHDNAIELIYKSPWEFMGDPAVLKNFQRIKIYSSEPVDSDFTIDIQTEKDFNADGIISECSITFEGIGYGTMEYGVDPYGSPGTVGLKHKLSNGRATSLRVILRNDEPQANIAVTGYELEINAPYAPGFKR